MDPVDIEIEALREAEQRAPEGRGHIAQQQKIIAG